MVRLRMTRMGRRHRPFYRINAVEKRTQRDGVVLERLGWYNPMAPEGKQFEIAADRVKDWLDRGASPSDVVADLVAKHHPEVIDPETLKSAREKRLTKKFKKIAEEKAAEEKAKAEAEAAAAAEAAEAAKGEGDAESKGE